jgi:putative endonuclease
VTAERNRAELSARSAASRQALGRLGEDAAARWYEQRGYQILARNWRTREGEIDLIARNGMQLAFCEVKARSSTSFGTPAESVNFSKRQRIRRLAARWLSDARSRSELGSQRFELRFDVASVMLRPWTSVAVRMSRPNVGSEAEEIDLVVDVEVVEAAF